MLSRLFGRVLVGGRVNEQPTGASIIYTQQSTETVSLSQHYAPSVQDCSPRACPAIFLPRDAMLSRYMLSSCVPPSARLSVCPSVTSRYCIETTGRIGLVLARRLPSTYTTLCYKEIWVSPKIRVLPSRTLSQIPDVENFATASRSRRQQNSSSSSSTVEFVDDTYTTVDESWLFTTRRSTVTL